MHNKIQISDSLVSSWTQLTRIQQSTLITIEQALKAADLPPLTWYDVLLELERGENNQLRPLELEQQLLLTQYNLSRLLGRIEKAGYIERQICAEDARGQTIKITQAGKTMRKKMWPVYASAIQQALDHRLSKQEMENLNNLLAQLKQPAKN